MSEEVFGIGFVSCGFITQDAHVPSLGYLPGVEVAGLQNRTRSTAVELAEEARAAGWGDPNVYAADEIAALTADPAVDGIWVTNPNFLRESAVDAIVDAVADGAELDGIAIEKPLARNLAEARRIRDRIEEVELPTAYLENWVHEPDIRDMRSLLWDQGRQAGRPYLARAQAEHGGPHSAWFWDGERQGGGALTDMLCHALAGNHVLLSDPAAEDATITPRRVAADTETLKWSQDAYASELAAEHGVDFTESPVDDYARTTVRYEDPDGQPLVSEATGSWCYVGAGVSRSIELLGPEFSGRVRTDESSSSVFFSDALGDGAGWAEKQTATSGRMPIGSAPEVRGGYVAENRDAVAAFRTGRDATLDLGFGKDILELCMAAYKAAEEGTEVDLQNSSLDEYVAPPARD